MLGFLCSWFLILIGLWISWIKTQTLSNSKISDTSVQFSSSFAPISSVHSFKKKRNLVQFKFFKIWWTSWTSFFELTSFTALTLLRIIIPSISPDVIEIDGGLATRDRFAFWGQCVRIDACRRIPQQYSPICLLAGLCISSTFWKLRSFQSRIILLKSSFFRNLVPF